MKIIQNNRQKVADARDKLAEIAKKSDARLKLLKMKETNIKISVSKLYYRIFLWKLTPVVRLNNSMFKTSLQLCEKDMLLTT